MTENTSLVNTRQSAKTEVYTCVQEPTEVPSMEFSARPENARRFVAFSG